MKILIADDEKEIVEAIKEFLIKKEYSVDIALDGKKALDLIKIKDYDLILLDENMPELTGLEIVEYIKNLHLKSKIIMLTGYPAIKEDFAKIIGVDEYLEKPIDLKKIEEAIRKHI